MHTPSIDRRTVRTRRAIHNAFATLAKRRDYEAIRVDDICAEAGVARSTFYGHFAGKDDLLRRIFDDVRRSVANPPGTGVDRSSAWVERAFTHAATRRSHLCLVASGRRREVALGELQLIFGAELRRELAATCPVTELSPRVAMGVAALLGLFEWWLADGARRSPAEMASLFRGAVETGSSDD